MIEQLTVRDYILFENAQIDFNTGMSVITGETGAGKSLLIDAIQAISGGRLSKGVVRKGKDKAVLEMVLSDPDQEVRAMLEENGFDASEDIVITRIVSESGKNRMLLNSRVTTNAFVSKIVARMVDIHSQMDTVTLMDPALQLELLDRYAGNGQLKEKTKAAYQALHKTVVEIKKLKSQTFTNEHLEKITKDLEEIQSAAIQENELEELEEKIKKAQDSSDALEDVSEALYLWRKESGISDQLYQAASALQSHAASEAIGSRLLDLYYQITDQFDLADEIKTELNDGAEDLDKMEERDFTIRSLYKKHGGTYQKVMEAEQSLNEQAERILHRQDVLDKLEKQKKEQLREYTHAASFLHQARAAAVPELKAKIEEHARDLMLEHCVFDVHFDKKPVSADGMDAIEFYASMNPGVAPSPLKQSASGGELSRLMLALKVVFQAENGIGTLVFDEIDTGVSGKVALAMGSKMHKLSENYQVLSITHLPSVAVWADDHYRVFKSTDGTITKTQVELLDEPKHIEELAIMANGSADAKSIESMEQLARRVRNG